MLQAFTNPGVSHPLSVLWASTCNHIIDFNCSGRFYPEHVMCLPHFNTAHKEYLTQVLAWQSHMHVHVRACMCQAWRVT